MNLFGKFPSLSIMYNNGWNTAKRFPFTIFSALTATIYAILMVESDKPADELIFQKIILISMLGIPLFTALKMYTERQGWNVLKQLYLQFGGMILLAIYYYSFPKDFSQVKLFGVQYALFYFCCLFLNSFLPFLNKKSYNGFWHYNKSLFLGFLTASLYAHVMGLGLTLALASLKHLFNMDIGSKLFFEIWIVVSILFHNWVFMGRLPKNLDELDNLKTYPKGLKVFTQYILLPLVCLYIIILYTYELKIMFTWNLPVGWVSNLVLWYSVVSILSLLLLHPLQHLKENKWIQFFHTWFFRGMIPLVLMLFVAIIQRISDYGITEARYIVFALAVGLAIVVFYFVISKVKDIRIIPVVVCLLALSSAFVASPISKISQQNRLESLLIQNSLFVDGQLVTPEEAPDFDSRKEMSSIVSYLYNTHGITAFDELLEDSIVVQDNLAQVDSTKIRRRGKKYFRRKGVNFICSHLGFEFISRWETTKFGNTKRINIRASDINKIDLTGYNTLFKLNAYNIDEPLCEIDISNQKIYLKFIYDETRFTFYTMDSMKEEFVIDNLFLNDTILRLNNIVHDIHSKSLTNISKNEIKALKLLHRLNEKLLYNSDVLSFKVSNSLFHAKLTFHSINGNKVNDSVYISSFDAVLLLKKKQIGK